MGVATTKNQRRRSGPRFEMNGLPISVFAVLLALLASMVDGYVFSNVRSGLIVALLSIGTLFGALLGAPVADYFGRRHAMSLECLIFCIGVVIQMATFHAWYQFAIGRLISGFGVGALSAAVPMYQAETAPAQIRGTLTGTYQLFITFGILLAYCIGTGTNEIKGPGSWRTVVGIGFIWAVILGVGIQFMPESPRWSARHGRPDAARTAIAKVRALPEDHPIVEGELEEMIASLEVEEGISKEALLNGEVVKTGEGVKVSGLQGWLSCFKGFRRGSSRVGYRTILGMTLQSLQQLTGANYFFYYGATIFKSSSVQSISSAHLAGLYVMERYGRRIPLIVGGIWQSGWLIIFAAAGTAKDPTTDKGIGKLMIVSACMFILGYAMTWAPGIWIIIGETFPTRTRAKQGALSTASNWLWNFLLAFFTPFIVPAIHFRYGFVFAGCNLLGAIVVYLFLYESSGMSLENVDLMYRDASAFPWTSRQWAPPGYGSRKEVERENKAKRAPVTVDGDSEKQSAGAGPGPQSTAGMGVSTLGAEEELRKENIAR
ncbi:general substrate transporter [Phellopilus nigrolimitatus]|nr:general substrate transporter [Phellopilus nigrolimitatus]